MNQKRNPAQENTYIKTNAEQITSAALSFQLKKKRNQQRKQTPIRCRKCHQITNTLKNHSAPRPLSNEQKKKKVDVQ